MGARESLAIRKNNNSKKKSRMLDSTQRLAIEEIVKQILEDVKFKGAEAVISNAITFDKLDPSQKHTPSFHPDLYLERNNELKNSYSVLSRENRECLERVKQRIVRFAQCQMNALNPVCFAESWGLMGHEILPVQCAGCYAPGGQYSLPSSVFMTVIPAKIAGVKTVIVASPNPSEITRAAAYLAGADALLAVGGAAAIGALAYGLPPYFDKCDVIVGPGNHYVVEAKKQISSFTKIDMLAGPSEIYIMADNSADPNIIAADLVAQAEHDVTATAVLVTDSERLADEVVTLVDQAVKRLPEPNRSIATQSLLDYADIRVVENLEEKGIDFINENAPEHVEIMTKNPLNIRKKLQNAGTVFQGFAAAEVFADYGAGPNHTLPTNKAARFRGGLSVYDFLKIRSFINSFEVDTSGDEHYEQLIKDTIQLAKIEGLHGHAMSAEARRNRKKPFELPTSLSLSTDVATEATAAAAAGELQHSELNSLVRSDAEQLMQYQPVQSVKCIAKEINCSVDELVKLNANENNYGPLPGLAEFVAKVIQVEANRYPDPEQTDLRRRLASFTGRSVEEVVCGAGADDVIQLLVEVCRPTGIVTITPTFAMYDFFGRIARCPVYSIPLAGFPDFNISIYSLIETVRETNSSLVFIASPNNPTGTSISLSDVELLCNKLKGKALIVIDESYVQFSNKPSCLRLIDKCLNLFVVQTFSKWASIAGLRCGYGVGNSQMIKRMFQIKIPYNLNIAASAAASYVLDNQSKAFEIVNLLKLERDHFYVMLLSDKVFPTISPVQSDANFLFMKIDSSTTTAAAAAGVGGAAETAKQLLQRLWKIGILTRGPYLDDNFLRISCGKPADTRKVIHNLSIFRNSADYYNKRTAFLFDMDGVLADVSESYRVAIMKTCHHYKATSVSKSSIENLKNEGGFNDDYDVSRELVKRETTIEVSMDELRSIFDGFYSDCCFCERLLVPLHELHWISRHVPMGIVTGRPRRDAETFMKRFNLDSIFSVVVTKEDTERHKPQPEPLLLAAEMINEFLLTSNPEQESNSTTTAAAAALLLNCLYFGDSVDDMRAAAAAATTTVAGKLVAGCCAAKFTPIGIIPPKTNLIEHAKVLYESGAIIVGLRWDCCAALGVPFAACVPGTSTAFAEAPADSASQLTTRLPSTCDLCGAPDISGGPVGNVKATEDTFTQTASVPAVASKRKQLVKRVTKETSIVCEVNLDGTGESSSCCTGVGFLDHMIQQLAKHASFDIVLKCDGDLQVDDHHSVEDCAIVLGETMLKALGDKRGIRRFGFALVPLDESLARTVVDLSGRGWCEASIQLPAETAKVGDLTAEMVTHFFSSFAASLKASIHIDVLKGSNSHHKVESCFKSLAVALKAAVSICNGRNRESLPSTKGLL